MIEFKTWLPQIVGYCNFVWDDTKVRQAWIDHDYSETSVTDFDELYEQVFDDLDANGFVLNLHAHLPNDERSRTAITGFLASLQDADRARTENPELRTVPALLDSRQWQLVRRAARAALDALGTSAREG